MRQPERAWWLWFASALVLLSPQAAHAQQTAAKQAQVVAKPAQSTARDAWFTVSIGGQPCGFTHEQMEVVGDRIFTTSELQLTLGRAGAQSTVAVKWRFEESTDGTPIACLVEQLSGSEQSQTSYRFAPNEVAVEERAGGRTITRVMPPPAGSWLTPAQAERLTTRERLADVAHFAYTTIDPASGLQLVEMKLTRLGPGEGETVAWQSTNNIVSVETIEEVDATGAVVSSRTKLPFGDMVSRRCTERQARAAGSTGGIDVIAKTLVELANPVPELLRGRSARLAVRAKDGALLQLPSAGAQRVAGNPDGGLLVDIEVGGSTKVTESEAADGRFLASTILIDSADPIVKELAATAVQRARLDERAAPLRRAEALRSFVARFITKKDLATAFAGASAVARSQAGDCSEHAVLLAALLRAQTIPSRVASGLVYADEFAGKRAVFAWHMWTQAQIDGAWIDLDATLETGAFHPGHLLIATSAQDDAQVDADFSDLLSTVGNIQIEVVRVD